MKDPRIAAIRVGALLLLLAAVTPALAAPTFARRYETGCATCHQAFPRLNAVGEAFRMAGFRFVDDERYRKVRPVEMGDEAYKRLWPRALWPTDIPRQSPLSIINRLLIEYDLDGSRNGDWTYLLPEEIELVWVGNIGEKFVFYGDAIFLQKDFGGLRPDSWVTLKAWLQYQSAFGVENKLNIRVGTVGTQTMGLFTARDANFYGTHFYLYTTWLMPPVDLGAAGLASFEGNTFSIGPQMGIEVNGFGKRWYYALGSVNGNLLWPNGGRPDSDVSLVGTGRSSNSRDAYGHFAYKFGGMNWDRTDEEPTDTLTPGGEFWRDDAVIVSLFGYRGKSLIESVDVAGARWEGNDDFWRFGAGVLTRIKDVQLSAMYLAGRNDNPYGNLTGEAVDSTTWHAEVLGFVYPWMLPYARYEVLDLDMPEGVAGIEPEQDIERLVAGVKFMVRPNMYAIVESAHYFEGEELEEGFDQTLFVLLGVSF